MPLAGFRRDFKGYVGYENEHALFKLEVWTCNEGSGFGVSGEGLGFRVRA